MEPGSTFNFRHATFYLPFNCNALLTARPRLCHSTPKPRLPSRWTAARAPLPAAPTGSPRWHPRPRQQCELESPTSLLDTFAYSCVHLGGSPKKKPVGPTTNSCDRRGGGVSLPGVPVPEAYIFDLRFWQAGLASPSFDENKCTWVHFRSAPGRQVVPGFEPPSQRRVQAVAYGGKSS